MKTISQLQDKMFEELHNSELFERVTEYGNTYISQSSKRNIYPTEEALIGLKNFEEELPEEVSSTNEVVKLLQDYGAPASVSQIGGRYFGFVNGGVIPAGLIAKQLAMFWDQNSAMQVISPICSKLESVVQQWLVQLFGFPKETVAGFVSGTMMANFCGLAAARYRILQKQGWDVNEQGLIGAPSIRVVTGKEAHSTILKAISLIGLGKNTIEWVDVDEQGTIIADDIPSLDERTILILQAGNVHSGDFDPFHLICEKARKAGAWIHIDGAFGLWAGATKQMKKLTQGFEYAHSWAVDGHKTLNTPYDSGIVLCQDKEALVNALHMVGSYIIKGEERDGMFFTPEMSRRSRIIELWATLRFLGKKGIDELIVSLHDRAVQFADLFSELSGFEVLNKVVFNQVVVRCKTDEITDKVLENVQKHRVCWVGGSRWKGRRVIRISVCSWVTTEEDVKLSIASFQKALAIANEIV